MKEFKELPESVQSEVKETLVCYKQVHVEKNNNHYEVSPHVMIHNGTYSEFIGTFKPSDVMTIEEWRHAYLTEFNATPFGDYGWS